MPMFRRSGPVVPISRRERARVRRAFDAPTPGKTGRWKAQAAIWGLGIFGGAVTGSLLIGWPIGAGPTAATDGRASTEWPAVTARFGACKWGGGTNCVVDGDTIYLGGAKIRVADIDAPETHDYRCPEELALGERAAVRLEQLVNSGPVTLETSGRDADRYGRKLRVVMVGGVSVGDTLVGEGLARPYRGGRRSWCA